MILVSIAFGGFFPLCLASTFFSLFCTLARTFFYLAICLVSIFLLAVDALDNLLPLLVIDAFIDAPFSIASTRLSSICLPVAPNYDAVLDACCSMF